MVLVHDSACSTLLITIDRIKSGFRFARVVLLLLLIVIIATEVFSFCFERDSRIETTPNFTSKSQWMDNSDVERSKETQ